MRASKGMVVHNNTDARVVTKVDDVVFWLEVVEVAKVGFEQNRVVVIGAEGAVVDEPKVVCTVGLEGNIELLSDRRLGVGSDPVVWD